jgi:hypothetical protein
MQNDLKNQMIKELRKIVKEIIKAEKTTTGKVNVIVAVGTLISGMLRGDLIYILLVLVGSGILADFVIRRKGDEKA